MRSRLTAAFVLVCCAWGAARAQAPPAIQLFLPGGTDKAITTKVQQAVAQIVKEPETRKMLLAQGLDAVASSPDEFARMYNAELVRWAKVVKAVGLQPQ